MTIWKYFLACCALIAVTPTMGRAQLDWLPTIPAGNVTVRLESAMDSWGAPTARFRSATDMVEAPDGSGRFFVATLRGHIRVIDASGHMLPLFLDTNNAATFPNMYQFTTVALHPQFGDVGAPGYGKFYTVETERDGTGTPDMTGSLKTVNPQHQQALYEYALNDANASVFAGTKREVIRFQRPGNSHTVNDVVFGPDGYMYVSEGDGKNDPNQTGVAMGDNAQFLGNDYGKILRIDPLDPSLTPGSADPISANGKYRVPADNPFVGDPDPNTPADESLDEIFAYGFRNPYRLTFDRLTGDLYTGSVGQRSIEAVYKIEKGGNHGWNKMEGGFIYDKKSQFNLIEDEDLNGDGKGDFAAANNLIEPVFEYDHQDGVAVVGGFVYRGTAIPELFGKYVFGEFLGGEGSSQGRLFYGDLATGDIFEFNIDLGGQSIPGIVYSIGEDAEGEIYALGSSIDNEEGYVLRLAPAALVGDTNGDGAVDILDLNNVRNSFGSAGAAVIGDAYPKDGDVDIQDLNAVRNNFGRELNSVPAPEPATWSLLAISGIAFAAVRHRASRRRAA